ncbi:MAG: ribosomal L7Ae/L30e/S12e/Gadd45 family protein [Oscillospiraceae bacterium]|nr:ribosomal L7Ae/L30e/S12e/Gadd45 family protein [Oscillospiraceae bacterium]
MPKQRLCDLSGVRQAVRAVGAGTAARVYIAADAEEKVTLPLRRLCGEKGVPVTEVGTMAELGEACGLKVGASAACATNGHTGGR